MARDLALENDALWRVEGKFFVVPTVPFDFARNAVSLYVCRVGFGRCGSALSFRHNDDVDF